MMRIGTIILALLMTVALYSQSYVVEEGFEGGALPDGWSQEYVSGDLDWVYDTGGHSDNPPEAHTGTYNALLYLDSANAETTRLITPTFNISGTGSILRFWHTQGLWSSDQDELYVYFQENSGSAWTLLASWTGDIPDWTQEEISLPDGSANSRIAFEGVAKYGWGVCLDDITVETLGPEYDNDLMAVSVDGTENPSVGDPYEYSVTVRNVGALAQDDYTVKLLLEDGTVIDEVDGVALELNEEQAYVLEWTPEETGDYNLRAEVVLANDENPDNNLSALFPVTVHPYGTIVISVGDGTNSSYRVPLNFFYKTSLTETMYYPEELQVTGAINTIEYYNNFTSSMPSKPVVIWMGETTLSDLSAGWIPAGELTQVFDGVINFPPGENAVQIPLDEAYFYNGGNLVMLVMRPFEDDYYSDTDKFYISEDADQYPSRTIRWQHDTVETDPNDPEDGTVVDFFPNTTFYFTAGSATGIMGIVSDQNGQPVNGVEVVLTPGGHTFTTNSEGFYQFYGLDAGTYGLSFTGEGYFDGSVEEIELASNQMLEMDLTIMEQLEISLTFATGTSTNEGVTVYGATADSLYTFEVETGADGIAIATDVYPGYYDLVAMRTDLDTWTLNNVEILSNFQINVDMTETITPPLNPACTTEAVFTWQSPYYRYLQEYEVYLDGEYVASTTDTTYTFNPDSLTIDESYTAGVLAVFETGQSELATVDFVFEGVATGEMPEAPVLTGISSIYPNPFNPETNIRFSLQNPSVVKLDIFNVRGQKVRSLVSQRFDSGNHTVTWNGRDDYGKSASTGIYYLRMQTGSRSFVKKMMMVK